MTASAIRVDLVSDTATRPCKAMRRAMAEAEVGDEQRGEDPSVNALTERVADLLGQESALFLPSGTMCNQIALAVHCSAGDEVFAASNAHIVNSEAAGAAVFARSVIRNIPSATGIFTPDQLREAIQPDRVKSPRSSLVSVEQTTNRGGGAVWPLDVLAGIVQVAREHRLKLHMDGARLMNAVVASGVDAKTYAARFDSAWLDISKGLGCPVGGVLAGSAAFIEEANVWKHRFGGAMRQAGILAAAGLYALDHNVERLAEDHANARTFADVIAELPGVKVLNPEVPTNLVFFDISETGKTTAEIGRRLKERHVRIGIESASQMRAVFHLDVDAAQTKEAGHALAAAIQ